MVIQVKVPAVGESVTEAVVGRWFKESGDYVRVDEPVCEIESEKATMELNAEAAGRLTVTVPTGRTVPSARSSPRSTPPRHRPRAHPRGRAAAAATPAPSASAPAVTPDTAGNSDRARFTPSPASCLRTPAFRRTDRGGPRRPGDEAGRPGRAGPGPQPARGGRRRRRTRIDAPSAASE